MLVRKSANLMSEKGTLHEKCSSVIQIKSPSRLRSTDAMPALPSGLVHKLRGYIVLANKLRDEIRFFHRAKEALFTRKTVLWMPIIYITQGDARRADGV